LIAPLRLAASVTPAARSAGRRRAWRNLRICILLTVLLFVAVTDWRQGYLATRWRAPLFVAIYPVALDASPATLRYVAALEARDFEPIDRFFEAQAARYGVPVGEPFRTRLRPLLHESPPERPSDAGIFGTMLWSLRLRYWAGRVARSPREPDDIRVFVLYRDPALSPRAPDSLGLAKGLIGVVHAFADSAMTGANDVVIAHELLHTLGATDKYDPSTNAPRFPDGFGDPAQLPRYPQASAELMAGRRALAPDRGEQVQGLGEVVIGPVTAREIRWSD
jgi:hypothetical protein